ncbi:uncharacterized protein LOC142235999 [Haematobia irritans]|uniref:uncharacterized protein LOC142235999 n=1 Tax=Haematobia irritans TaxID=7368 RepID=UPI003F50C310
MVVCGGPILIHLIVVVIVIVFMLSSHRHSSCWMFLFMFYDECLFKNIWRRPTLDFTVTHAKYFRLLGITLLESAFMEISQQTQQQQQLQISSSSSASLSSSSTPSSGDWHGLLQYEKMPPIPLYRTTKYSSHPFKSISKWAKNGHNDNNNKINQHILVYTVSVVIIIIIIICHLIRNATRDDDEHKKEPSIRGGFLVVSYHHVLWVSRFVSMNWGSLAVKEGHTTSQLTPLFNVYKHIRELVYLSMVNCLSYFCYQQHPYDDCYSCYCMIPFFVITYSRTLQIPETPAKCSSILDYPVSPNAIEYYIVYCDSEYQNSGAYFIHSVEPATMTGKKRQTSPCLATSLESLRSQKAASVANIERIRQSVKDKTISFNPIEIECRMEILNSYINTLMAHQSELDLLDPTNGERASVEDLCVSTKSLFLKILSNHRKSSVAETSFSVQHQSKLPNEALGTVRAFQITEQNYPKAIASLKRVYDNDCLIFFDNISKLFNLPEMSRPSSSSLRNLIDSVSAIYDSLLSIGDEKNITNAILIHLVMSKVDSTTRTKWEEQLDYNKLPLWSECEAALNKRYQHIAADESSTSKDRVTRPSKDPVNRRHSKTSLSCSKGSKAVDKCTFCKSLQHEILTCPSFGSIPVLQRFDFVKSIPACINCLKKGHTVSRCKAPRCRICSGAHNALLHRFTETQSGSTLPSNEQDSPSPVATVNTCGVANNGIILATALVEVRSSTGEYISARALLDSGSQPNLITEELSQRLRLKKEPGLLNLVGIGETYSSSRRKLQATIKSRINSYQFCTDFWVMETITSKQPDHKIPDLSLEVPNNVILADPFFHKPQKIDLLIGAEIFFELLCVGQIKSGPSQPILQKTLLGWIVAGKYNIADDYHLKTCNIGIIEREDSIDYILKRFWELEELPRVSNSIASQEQQECEAHFQKTVKRLQNGRIEVALPFKSDPSVLGQSYEIARRRFLSLERRMQKDEELRKMYHIFMNEYINLGHMSIADSSALSGPHYVIPHQCVLRPQSSSTKLRVVFDASCRTSSNVSLNDLLMVGPTIQEDLYSTLIRFRLHKYVVTADIEKMYRQVLIDEADRNYQLVLYRRSPQDEINIYRLNTVTYGTSSAPFLAIRCLQYLSEIYKELFPRGSLVLRKGFYVDDLLTGADSIEELSIIKSELIEILNSAGFNITKWLSNYSENCRENTTEKLLHSNSEYSKALGVYWNPKNDILTFQMENNYSDLKATKRNILSVSSRLFDPLGLVCPIIIRAKMLLQELWVKKIDWDESIPQSLNTEWENFKSTLQKIKSIQIPRYVNTTASSKCDIHGFADASLRAYGCCIYIRTAVGNETSCHLLTAKSKVSPLKTKSLPRLELCAAHMLTCLWSKIRDTFCLNVQNIYFWTDSEIVLHWISMIPSSLATFVSNKVSEIQENSGQASWRHVPGKFNPADIVSRGCNAEELNSSIWFHGPSFLIDNQETWPRNPRIELSEEQKLLEMRKAKVFATVSKPENDFLRTVSKWSSYYKILNITAYIFRFINRIKGNCGPRTISITSHEIKYAFLKIVEIVQKTEYADEIRKIKACKNLPASLQSLTPFVHVLKLKYGQVELVRVGGRLLNAPLKFESKFPLLLPKGLHFTTVYLRHLHITNCHAGPKALLAILRQKIWLVNARDECRKIVRQCVHCFHYRPKLRTQLMGNLPMDRVVALRPFLIVGVDFCGPVNISMRIRGKPPTKMFIAVFVCFTSKAVHLELVSNLTSECFLLCFKRFVSRRGLPSKVLCDNGTNFVGADRKLKELYRKLTNGELVSQAAKMEVEFSFIPPRAPHFGGLWEAAVKSAKYLLIRAIGSALLSVEEFQTVLVEVEAVLNSRPITPLSTDPNDGAVLTPAHLLIGGDLLSLPQEFVEDVPDCKLGSLRRWQQLCIIKQKFWRAWSRDYILGLQNKGKWVQDEPNVEVGQLALIHEDNLPPQHWLTGRVITVVKGKDGKVRVAEVQTKNGILKRPITKLAILPQPHLFQNNKILHNQYFLNAYGLICMTILVSKEKLREEQLTIIALVTQGEAAFAAKAAVLTAGDCNLTLQLYCMQGLGIESSTIAECQCQQMWFISQPKTTLLMPQDDHPAPIKHLSSTKNTVKPKEKPPSPSSTTTATNTTTIWER